MLSVQVPTLCDRRYAGKDARPGIPPPAVAAGSRSLRRSEHPLVTSERLWLGGLTVRKMSPTSSMDHRGHQVEAARPQRGPGTGMARLRSSWAPSAAASHEAYDVVMWFWSRYTSRFPTMTGHPVETQNQGVTST